MYWKPYVPVAQRRAEAQKTMEKAAKAGKNHDPVRIEGRKIAKTFWGEAWCDNLESYSDYESRLPRGRTYARNGSVIDLRIEPGQINALVMGSSLYEVKIGIDQLQQKRWKTLVKDCTGSIASLVELLQGRLSKAVMERICAPKTGLFPAPKEIQIDCSCPDWATLCKHAAAALYGVGARLDEKPELLFVLRQVDANELLSAQMTELPKVAAPARVLEEDGLADIFGIDFGTSDIAQPKLSQAARPTTKSKPSAAAKATQTPQGTKAKKRTTTKATAPKKPLAQKKATKPPS